MVAVYIARAVALIIILAFVSLLFVLSWKMIRGLIRLMRWNLGMLPPGYFKPDEWKRLVEMADPIKQSLLLTRTNHQTLGMNAEQFLDVLRNVSQAIKEEPALSTYWNQRDQLEQVLKQERLG